MTDPHPTLPDILQPRMLSCRLCEEHGHSTELQNQWHSPPGWWFISCGHSGIGPNKKTCLHQQNWPKQIKPITCSFLLFTKKILVEFDMFKNPGLHTESLHFRSSSSALTKPHNTTITATFRTMSSEYSSKFFITCGNSSKKTPVLPSCVVIQVTMSRSCVKNWELTLNSPNKINKFIQTG